MERMAHQSYGLKTVISKISTIRTKKWPPRNRLSPQYYGVTIVSKN